MDSIRLHPFILAVLLAKCLGHLVFDLFESYLVQRIPGRELTQPKQESEKFFRW
jgi:hypothetical protein